MNGDGKFDQGRYHTIPETKNIKLPIGEHIRLGYRVVNEKGVTHPVETAFFVCPKKVKEIFGDEPTELTVFFPRANRVDVFPQAYEKYGGNNAMLCWGDGEVSKTAQRLNLENGRWEDRECPCEHFKKYDPKTKIGGCSKVGHLRFMIPEVSIGTFFECTVHGTVSISEINSGFEVANDTTGGAWAMIPFRMRRVAKKLKIPGTAKMKTHWVVTLEVAASTEEIKRVKAGQILYLGQQKDGEYVLEDPELPDENRAYTREETKEEIAIREAQAKEAGEAEAVFIKESREREEQLKKDRAAGKTRIKTKEEVKVIQAKKAKLKTDIEALAKEHGIMAWNRLIEIGRDAKIFSEGVFTAQSALQVLFDHPKKHAEFVQQIMKVKKPEDSIAQDIAF